MVKLYVEGGGGAKSLKTECRKGFTTFMTKAGISNRPRVVACGSRQDAYESFCTAISNGENAVLLVDSEKEVDECCQQGLPEKWDPWLHLRNREGDGWEKPGCLVGTDCHLMVQVMESWFLADRPTLNAFFGQGFREGSLPKPGRSIEKIAKREVYKSLEDATNDCKTKGKYGKGKHSFELLAVIDPQKIMDVSPWAKRFIDELKKKMDSQG